MRSLHTPLFALVLLALAGCSSPPQSFSVVSPAYENGGRIPQVYTCDGENRRPPLTVSNLPEGTESIAIIMENPDAEGGLFTHWAVWNIDPRITTIATDNPLAGATEGVNGQDAFGYTGPCPPGDTHRYVIRVFAVNRHFALPSTATPDDLKAELADYVIEQAEITGLYGRTPADTDAATATGTKTLPGSTIVE